MSRWVDVGSGVTGGQAAVAGSKMAESREKAVGDDCVIPSERLQCMSSSSARQKIPGFCVR